MSIIETRWKCDECGELHGGEDDARDCCRPSISEVYICPACGDWHREEAAAQECCAGEAGDIDAANQGPTAAELEAQGQMRLGYAP
jgi:hypothetical protein